MNPIAVQNALIQVLQRVQSRRGLTCPPLTGTSIPADLLENFTSKVWPAATTWLAKELGVRIPRDVHIFGTKRGGPVLTIDQAVALVCLKSQPREPQAEAAE